MRRLAHALARRCHRIAKQRRSAIVQVLDQRSVITAGILVEQPPQIGLGHRRYLRAGAEARQLQPRAVIIFRVGVARCTKGGHGGIAIAEPVADGAERKPGSGEAGAASTVCVRTSAAPAKSPRAASSTAALYRRSLTRSPEDTNNGPVSVMQRSWKVRARIDDEAQRDSSSLVSR